MDDGTDPDIEKIEVRERLSRKFQRPLRPGAEGRGATYASLSLKSVNKLQVVVTTVLVTIGWMFVVTPQSIYQQSIPRETSSSRTCPRCRPRRSRLPSWARTSTSSKCSSDATSRTT